MVIGDSLDRIALTIQEGDRTSHEHIFIDRHEQLRSLDCYLIYTVPISLVYSDKCTVLEDYYGTVQVLPMITTRDRQGHPDEAGVAKLKEMIERRAEQAGSTLDQVFGDDSLLTDLCLSSGGHVRNLMLLVKTALRYTDTLPIPEQAAQRAKAELRETYRQAINEDEWTILAGVHRNKKMPNQDAYRKLLFNRCILEYHSLEGDQNQAFVPWQDVHPLIYELGDFKKALSNLDGGETGDESSNNPTG